MNTACKKEMSVKQSNSPLLLTEKEYIKGRDGDKSELLVLLCEDPSELECHELAISTVCKICSNSLLFCPPNSPSIKLKLDRKIKGKRWERKVAFKITWPFPWTWEVWRKDAHCDRNPFPLSHDCSFPPREGMGSNTGDTARGTLQRQQLPSLDNFSPKVGLNWAVRPTWVTLPAEAQPLASRRGLQSRYSLYTYTCAQVGIPSSNPPHALTLILCLTRLSICACSVGPCSLLPASSCASSQWPASCLIGITAVVVQSGFCASYIH